MIFEHFLPGFFDQDTSVAFYGIGSILGFIDTNEKKKIIFSSGYAGGDVSTYGKPPIIDSTYDVVCVRGPLTAKALNIDPKFAIADGAILLRGIIKTDVKKRFKCAYMPHVGSLDFFNDWNEVLGDLDIVFVDPRDSVEKILDVIQSTELLLTEAMHGAIVADVLRTPWIPIKQYSTVNSFKWNDYLESMELKADFYQLPGIYSSQALKKIINTKFSSFPGFMNSLISSSYSLKQNSFTKRQLVSKFKHAKTHLVPVLSDESVLNTKYNLLLEKIELVKQKYKS